MHERVKEGKETKDKKLKEEGKKIGEEKIRILHKQSIDKLKGLYGSNWEKSIITIKADCLKRMPVNEDQLILDEENWSDYLEVSDYKEIIEKFWLIVNDDDIHFKTFAEEFSIQIQSSSSFNSKKDKLKWLYDFIIFTNSWRTTKGKPLTQANVDEMHLILESLQPFE